MIHRKNVKCGDTKPAEIEMSVDTVFKRTNIHQYSDSEGNHGYEYDEDELTLLEYFRESLPENQDITEETLGELSTVFALYQSQIDQTLAELSLLIEEVMDRV